MRTLLIGPSEGACRATLEALLRDRGHDVHLAAGLEDARAATEVGAADVEPFLLVVLSRADEETLAACRHLHRRENADVDRAPIALAVTPAAGEMSPQTLTEAGVDELIFDCTDTERLRAQLALAEARVERRAQRTRAEVETRRRAEQQAALARLGRQALNGSTREELLAQAARGVARALSVDYAAVLRQQGGGLIAEASAGARAKGGLPERAASPGSLVERVLQSNRPVVAGDLSGHDGEAGPLSSGARSGLLMRIAADPAPYGVLAAWHGAPRAFSEDDEYFMQAAASVLAGAIGRERTQRALRESEARARAVLKTTVDGIITIDEEGEIEAFNQAAEDIFGYAAANVQGENIKMLMPEPYRSEHDSYLENYHETGRRKIIGIGREVEGRRKDGSVFPMDLAVSEVQLDGRRLFTGVVRDISERRRLEREVLQISEEERRRIGHDLHDNLGQMLTGVGLLSRSLARMLKKEDAPGAEEASKIEQLIKEADEQARTLSRGLVPVDLEAKGLADALRRLARQTEDLSETRCSFREAGTGAVHDNTAATHLFRIAQEATSNAVKHGKASHIAVMLASGSGRIRLRVRDDGVGFPREEHARHEMQVGGLGVRTMQHRARLIGGTLEIQSTPGEGTAVTCTIRPDHRGSYENGPHGLPPGATGCPVH